MKINFKKRSEALRDTEQEQEKAFSLDYLLQVKTDEVEAVNQEESVNFIDNRTSHDTKVSESFMDLENSNRAPSYHEEQMPTPSFETMIHDEQGFESPFYESSVHTQEYTHE